MSKKVVFLGMGGTIAGTATSAKDNVGYQAGQVAVQQLLDQIPALILALGSCELVSEQVAQIDSKDMDFGHWAVLAQRVFHFLNQLEVQGLVITHGTDTLEETAYFLSRVLPPALLAVKPVVLTCAMRPASSMSPDGPQNILDAVALVCTPNARGVLVVCAGTIHAALHVQKVHPYRLDAFDSGEAGPLGYVEEGVVRWVHCLPAVDAIGHFVAIENLPSQAWPRVEIVMNYVGASGAIVRALCAPVLSDVAPVRGIVVAGTGNATMHADLESALKDAQASGVQVVRSTRCAYGAVVSGVLGLALPDSKGLSPVKARVALMLDLLN